MNKTYVFQNNYFKNLNLESVQWRRFQTGSIFTHACLPGPDHPLVWDQSFVEFSPRQSCCFCCCCFNFLLRNLWQNAANQATSGHDRRFLCFWTYKQAKKQTKTKPQKMWKKGGEYCYCFLTTHQLDTLHPKYAAGPFLFDHHVLRRVYLVCCSLTCVSMFTGLNPAARIKWLPV